MRDLRAAVVEVKAASVEVDEATSHFLSLTRTQQRYEILHAGLEGLAEALQRSVRASRTLALVLALDPDKLAGDEPLVEPIIDYVD